MSKKIDNIPGLIEQLIAEDIWKEVYVEETERTVTYDRFEDFLTTPPPEGLGVKVDVLTRMIGDDIETLNLLDGALQGKPGNPLGINQHTKGTVDISTVPPKVKRPTGTSRQAGIRKLRAARPDLLQRVLDKEMSVNQAMVEAGFRKKRVSIYADLDIIEKKLRNLLTEDQLNQLVEKR